MQPHATADKMTLDDTRMLNLTGTRQLFAVVEQTPRKLFIEKWNERLSTKKVAAWPQIWVDDADSSEP
jgi:hypothetical protein